MTDPTTDKPMFCAVEDARPAAPSPIPDGESAVALVATSALLPALPVAPADVSAPSGIPDQAN